jgi:hypothetical protein
VLSVDHTQQPAAAAAAQGCAAGPGANAWQQQQQQGLKMAWVTVEDFLEDSCVGAARTRGSKSYSSSSSSEGADWITAEGVAGGKQLDPSQQQQQHTVHAHIVATDAGLSSSDDGYRVVTAVWLPYGNGARELFWSYKVALRHVNSHALVNAAAWFRFQEDSLVDLHSSSSSSKTAAGGGSSVFAGRVLTSARMFAGFPPEASAAAATANVANPAAADVATAAAAAAAGGVTQQQRGVEEPWRVLRLSAVEQQLQGQAVDVKVRQQQQQQQQQRQQHDHCIQ